MQYPLPFDFGIEHLHVCWLRKRDLLCYMAYCDYHVFVTANTHAFNSTVDLVLAELLALDPTR